MKLKSKVLIVISVCILIIGSIVKSYNIIEKWGISFPSAPSLDDINDAANSLADSIDSLASGLNINNVISDVKKKVDIPVNEAEDLANQTKKEIENTTNSVVSKLRSDIATIKSSIDDLPNKVLNNNFINDMQKEIDSTFNSIIDKLKDSIDDIMGAFGKMGIIFIEIFNTFNEMVNIMKSTFNFLIGIINQLKKCNLVYIKAKPIRARFREVMSKMFELVILQIQFIQPDVILNPFLIGNYLNNISKKQIELNKIFITNLS